MHVYVYLSLKTVCSLLHDPRQPDLRLYLSEELLARPPAQGGCLLLLSAGTCRSRAPRDRHHAVHAVHEEHQPTGLEEGNEQTKERSTTRHPAANDTNKCANAFLLRPTRTGRAVSTYRASFGGGSVRRRRRCGGGEKRRRRRALSVCLYLPLPSFSVSLRRVIVVARSHPVLATGPCWHSSFPSVT